MSETVTWKKLDTVIELLEKQNRLLSSIASQAVQPRSVASNEMNFPQIPDVKGMIAKARREAEEKVTSARLAANTNTDLASV